MKKWIILFLIPLVIGISASASGFSLVWKLLVLSIMTPAVCFLWSFLTMRGIKAEVHSLPPKSRIGDILDNKLSLTSLTRIPKLFLRVQENSDMPGYTNISTFNLAGRGTFNLETSPCCLRRGQYNLGSYTLTVSDPLGLFRREKVVGQGQRILIYPDAVDLPFFDPLTSLSLAYGAGQWVQAQISPNVSSIREYSSGDSLRHIHWGSTAHSGQLMVKLFDPDRSYSSAKTIWVVLDMQWGVQAGSGIQSTEEYGVSIAASLVKKYIESGWPVGFMTASDRKYIFAPANGSRHIEEINSTLALIKAEGEIAIEELILSESSRFDSSTLIIVITPAWKESLISPLLQLKAQQGVVTAILIEPQSFRGETGRRHISQSLALNGVRVYVVGKGDNLAAALDTRNLSANKL
jgi:uncharacterized protein (DUF58 family)